MPPKTIDYIVLHRKLLKLGFELKSIKGSHHKYIRKYNGYLVTAIVPKHKEITYGTLKSIFKQGFITEDEFNQA